jgi:hypothetical protein
MNATRLLPENSSYGLIVLFFRHLRRATERGTLRGAITDELGAVIVGANVT